MLWCADSRAYCPFRGRCCVVLCIHTSTLPTATRESVGVCGRRGRTGMDGRDDDGIASGCPGASPKRHRIKHKRVLTRGKQPQSHM